MVKMDATRAKLGSFALTSLYGCRFGKVSGKKQDYEKHCDESDQRTQQAA